MDRKSFDDLMKMSEDEIAKVLASEPPAPGQIAETFVEAVSQSQGMQFGFDVVEVQRVNLQPGDTLMVTVKNDDLSQDSVDALRKQLQVVFPDNKVFVFAMGTSDDVQLSIVSQATQENVAGCSTTSYCSDCNCGKKEQATGGSNVG